MSLRVYQFVVDGQPIGKQRPIFGQGRVRSGDKSRAYEKKIALVARGFGVKVIPRPFRIRLELVIHQHNWTTDVDNIFKSVCDALQGVAFEGDTQVDEIAARRVRAPVGFEHVDVTVTEMG